MSNCIEDRRKKIKNELKKVRLLTYIGYTVSIFLCANMIVNVLPIINVILIIFNVDVVVCQFIINLMGFVLRFAPISIYVIGNMKSREILRELSFYGEGINKISECQELSKEEQVDLNNRISDIKREFESLSRSQQMEVLNCIKEYGKLCQIQTEKNNFDQKTIDLLQDEFEEILFPSISPSESSYTRKKLKK